MPGPASIPSDYFPPRVPTFAELVALEPRLVDSWKGANARRMAGRACRCNLVLLRN